MRRIACTLTAVALAALIGCQKADKAVEPEQDLAVDYYTPGADLFPATIDAPAQAVSDFDVDNTYVFSTSEPLGIDATSFEPVTDYSRLHTVVKGDTLYKLARQYYSDQARWRDIFEANTDVLKNPNLLFTGQQLVIP